MTIKRWALRVVGACAMFGAAICLDAPDHEKTTLEYTNERQAIQSTVRFNDGE